MSEGSETWTPIDHLCRWCGSGWLEEIATDPGRVRCPNPKCAAETAEGHRDLCFCGGLDDDAPIHFQCVKNRRRTRASPDEIIVVEVPATPRAAVRR
jgi:hypothetical protein